MLCYRISLVVFFITELSEQSYFDGYYDNQKQFVEWLIACNRIRSKRVANIFLQVNRHNYTHKSHYEDMPRNQPKGGQYKPINMQAFALDYLRKRLKPGGRVLDLGCGSGYLTACMALMVNDTGFVIGVLDSDLAPIKEIDRTLDNVRRNNPMLLEKKLIKFVEADLYYGYPEEGPYDVIHVGEPFDEVPQYLVDQLKPGGRMMIPLYGVNNFRIFLYDKLQNGTVKNRLLPYLPYDNIIMDRSMDYREVTFPPTTLDYYDFSPKITYDPKKVYYYDY